MELHKNKILLISEKKNKKIKKNLSFLKTYSFDYIKNFKANKLNDYSLIIIDLKKNQYSKIKKLHLSKPFIILTKVNKKKQIKKLLSLNALDILKKPICKKELKNKIAFYLNWENTKKTASSKKNLLEEYKHAVDKSVIVSKTDKYGVITYVNEAFEKISGYKKEELLGKPHNIIRHNETKKEEFSKMWKIIKTNKKTWSGKLKNLAKDGSTYIVETTINPILDEKGEIVEFIAIRKDITEHEMAKEFIQKKFDFATSQYEEILDLTQVYEKAMNKSNAIIRVNKKFIITYANEEFCKLSKYDKSELIGKPYSLLQTFNNKAEKLQKIWDTCNNNEIWKGSLVNKDKNSEEFHCISTVVPLKNKQGEIYEYMGIRQDITGIVNLHKELEETQREIIYRMGEIGETRSRETGNHVKRVAYYSKILALKAGLSQEEAEILKKASPMHDIGKVAIEDSILNKNGRLTQNEYEVMKEHASIGYKLLKDSKRPILKASAIVAHEHHEKWDGSGYPRGLKAEEIHIFGRITAIADVFDALGSDRVYKKAWPLERILEFFLSQREKHFDPKLVDLFLENLDEFLEVRDKYK